MIVGLIQPCFGHVKLWGKRHILRSTEYNTSLCLPATIQRDFQGFIMYWEVSRP